MVEKNEDLQFYIRDMIKKIDDNFIIVFTRNTIHVSYSLTRNSNERTLSFIKVIRVLMKYIRLEKMLLQEDLVLSGHKTMELGDLRIKVEFPLKMI
jgi:hypothetical protein